MSAGLCVAQARFLLLKLKHEETMIKATPIHESAPPLNQRFPSAILAHPKALNISGPKRLLVFATKLCANRLTIRSANIPGFIHLEYGKVTIPRLLRKLKYTEQQAGHLGIKATPVANRIENPLPLRFSKRGPRPLPPAHAEFRSPLLLINRFNDSTNHYHALPP